MLERLDRWSRWTVAITFCLLPLAVYGAFHLPVGSASVHEWLPDGQPERQRYERFLREFGDDQFLMVSWEDCRVDDPRIESFETAVQGEAESATRLISSVRSTRDVLKTLMEPPLSLPVREAASRLSEILIGRDGTATVIVQFTEYGIKHQKQAIAHVHQAADEVPNLGRDKLRMAGTVYEAYAVDESAERSLTKLVLPSCIMGIVLAWLCLRSVRAALAVLVIAGIGQLLAVATVYYTGGQFSAVLIVLPTLVFMLTLSGAVHLMNYYGDVAAWHNDHLGSRAMLLGFTPSLLASVTTALGMAALATSKLAPVREFGIYSAFCLSVATVFLLLGFPLISDWFCRRRKWRRRTERDEAGEPDAALAAAAGHPAHIVPTAARYVRWIEPKAVLITAAGFLLIAISFYGLFQLQTSTKFDDMFPSNSPTVRDMTWIEQHVGPIASVEVLLRFAPDSPLDTYSRIEWVHRVAEGVKRNEAVGGVMSAATFLPDLPQSGSLRDVTRRSAMRKALSNSASELQQRGWVSETDDGQLWRVTAKVSAMSEEDYGALTRRVAASVNGVLAESKAPAPFTAQYTGLSPVMHETQLLLLDDLGASFTTAFLLITPVMMLIARSFWAGLLIMIPNVLPETLVFGSMAWLGFQLDIAGILTASVAMGIAVNDTLHFVNWYVRRLSLGDSRATAIADTLTSCAGAMFHTMLISCCSMLPFMLAEFIPTRQFACLMIAMLSSALLGDLVLLPALLLSPLGLCLVPRRNQAVSANTPMTDEASDVTSQAR